jgi:hypothetical protein
MSSRLLLMKPGVRVSHTRYGKGIVVKQWGSWRACMTCRGPLDTRGRCEVRAHNIVKATTALPWPHAHAFDISGHGVADVDFGGFGIRSISTCWLREIPVLREKRTLARSAESH